VEDAALTIRALGLLIAGALVGCSAPVSIPLIEDERRPMSAVLIRALQDETPQQRARAALAMGRIQSRGYVDALIHATGDDETAVRLAALFALGQMGLSQNADELPTPAVDACLSALGDDDPAIVAGAAQALGKLATERVPAALIALLEHESPLVRIEAALGLFRCRFAPLWRGEAAEPPPLPEDAVRALIDAIGDEDAAVRRAAVYAHSRYGQPEAAEALSEQVDDDDEWVRLFAVRGIGRSETPEVAERLVPALRDPSERVRAEAVAALASLEALARLPSSLAADPSFHVRAAVAAALGDGNDARTLESLNVLEADPSTTVRAAAIGALVGRPDHEPGERLSGWLGEEDWRIRAAAARAAGGLQAKGLGPIERALQDPDNRVRTAALAALGDLASSEAADELILAALEVDDLAVRGTAVGLLAERGDAQRVVRLSRAYDGSSGVEWIEIREAVVEAVAELEDAEALLRRAATGDAAASVRSKARAALASRGIDLDGTDLPPIEPSELLDVRFAADPVVILETSQGEIEIRCLAREAPIHVAGFVDLTRSGYYDGLIWHRVVSNFVIQGGDPRGDGWGGAGYTMRDEINSVRFERGMVGMPKAGKDTGGGQIFITHVPTPHLDGNYTVFGQVVSGLDVVDRIEVGDRIVRAQVK
jgi:cyclophilin family peptidyl-prolyl cis-trans isomerase